MWPTHRVAELLQIEHPIIQAPMLGSAHPSLAAAVCNAGGLGSIACGELPCADVRSLHTEMVSRSDRPFNMNFFVRDELPVASRETLASVRSKLAPLYRELTGGEPPTDLGTPTLAFDLAMAELLAELRPAVVSFHFGIPEVKAIDMLKEAGIAVLSTATNVAEAVRLEDAGIDAVIAQGWEAGGHRGSHRSDLPDDGIGSLALVPQVADAVSLPVIAAGGITDGRGIAAAFALGASGVQIGSGFLRCPEASTDSRRRELILHATDQDTVVTDAVSGRCARAARSPYAELMRSEAGKLPDYPLMYRLSGPLMDACQKQDRDMVAFHLYGQAAALATDLPAADLVDRLVSDTFSVFRRLAP